MRPNVSAVYGSQNASLTGAGASGKLRTIMQASPICLIPRILDSRMLAALDEADVDILPAFDVSGDMSRIRQSVIAAALGPDGVAETVLAAWLRDDILELVDLIAGATGADTVRVRLQVVIDDMCCRFHTDDIPFRLVTTYRGPGTEWLSPRSLAEAPSSQALDASTIRRMDRGTIAIMRGGKNATADRPGLLDRSPPIAGSGTARLFLAIDTIGGDIEPRITAT